jgi:hypothetical protein
MMSKKAFIAGSGKTVNDAAADAVRKHYEDRMSLSEIDNIVVEENGKRKAESHY